MKINNYKQTKLATAISIAVMPFLLGTSLNAFAAEQDNKAAIKKKETEIEQIEVIGVRSSLEEALHTKMSASSIVDAISSKDIDSLPALDLGEALQAIPGIQVNREGERRSSEINLRGLPGGFVKTTANGQGFASPSRSVSKATSGEPNPFGSFDAKVFDGVTVIKSPTADLQEGGIAGIIDKQLANALNNKDNSFRIQLESRYEELNDSWDPGLALSGTKHFIKDVFAGTFKFATSEQNFRRDSIAQNAYATLDSRLFSGLDDWKAAQGIPAEDTVQYSRDNRQYTEYNEGTRTSFVGGLEWQVNDELKLGADVLYTQRDMDESTLEILGVNTGYRNKSGMQVTPVGDAFYGADLANGTGSWVVPHYNFENASYTPGNRGFSFLEEAKGLFLDAIWTRDNWTVDGVVSVSNATNEFVQTQFQSTYKPVNSVGGISGSLNTGAGDVGDYSLIINDWQNASNLDQDFAFSTSPADDISVKGADKKTLFYAAGGQQTRDRDEKSFELNTQYTTDMDFITAIKVGVRSSTNELESGSMNNSINGMNIAGISNAMYAEPHYKSATNFFGGEAPGFVTVEGGWLSMDVDLIEQVLWEGGIDNPNNLPTTLSGQLARTEKDQVTPKGLADNFDSSVEINAIYAMVDFETEIGDIEVWGNAGVRYVETKLDATGWSMNNGAYEQLAISNEYNNTLPSFNIAAQLHEEVILRAAYSETMVRPSLAAFKPSGSLSDNDTRVKIDLPRSDLDPYTAKSYDLSLEWYNREGSAVTFAVYQKDIKSFFETTELCPEDGGGYGYGSLEFDTNTGVCSISTPYDDDNGTDPYLRDMEITKTVNIDDVLTITGYEMSIQQNLDFLPGFWSGFGGILNYSYVTMDDVDLDGDGVPDVNLLPGVSETSYNAIGYWENKTFSFRLAYNYRDDYMLSGGGSFVGSEDRYVKGRGQLDMSATYRATKNLRFGLRAYNLTEVMYEEYLGNNAKKSRRTNWDGRTFSLSASYTF